MSEERGKLITCTRCTNTIFLKYLRSHGGSNYSDPGYLRAEYEELPKTWMVPLGIGHLCPDCSRGLVDVLINYFGESTYDKFDSRWKLEEEK